MSRIAGQVRCDRPTGRHVLASLRADDSGVMIVDTREAATTPGGIATVAKQYRDADIGDLTSLMVRCACGCGVQFHVDIAALMRRDPVTAIRVQPESTTGVSYNRRRHNGPVR